MTQTAVSAGSRLRCTWSVTAGIIPGEPIPDYSRQWCLTSEQWEKDLAAANQGNPDPPWTFLAYQTAAREYAQSLENPRSLNWVKCEWMWL